MSEAATIRHNTDADSTEDVIGQCKTECLDHTIEAFQRAGLADDVEIQKIRQRYEAGREDGTPIDLLELLARMKGTEEEHMGAEVSRIAHEVNNVLSPAPPLIPFAGKLMAPSSFYEAYTQLHELSRELLAPVIFAEDTDAIGTGALNPVAAHIMGGRILAAVNRRFAIRPFVTVVRLDYESWSFLCRKHYGL